MIFQSLCRFIAFAAKTFESFAHSVFDFQFVHVYVCLFVCNSISMRMQYKKGKNESETLCLCWMSSRIRCMFVCAIDRKQSDELTVNHWFEQILHRVCIYRCIYWTIMDTSVNRQLTVPPFCDHFSNGIWCRSHFCIASCSQAQDTQTVFHLMHYCRPYQNVFRNNNKSEVTKQIKTIRSNPKFAFHLNGVNGVNGGE